MKIKDARKKLQKELVSLITEIVNAGMEELDFGVLVPQEAGIGSQFTYPLASDAVICGSGLSTQWYTIVYKIVGIRKDEDGKICVDMAPQLKIADTGFKTHWELEKMPLTLLAGVYSALMQELVDE